MGVKFNCVQVSDFACVVEKHDMNIDFVSDAQAGEMFSELLTVMARSLTEEQALTFWETLLYGR